MKTRYKSSYSLATSLAISLTVSTTFAGTQYWTGSGTWGTGTNWSNATGGPYNVAWTNTTSDVATFEGTGGTVTLGTARNAKTLSFNVTGYEIKAASLLAISGTGATTVQLASGVTAKIGDNVTFQSSSTNQNWTLTSTSKTSILNLTGTIKNTTPNNNAITGITVNVNTNGLLQSANSLVIGGTSVGADLNLAGGKLEMTNLTGDTNIVLNNTPAITSSSTLTIGTGGEISFAKTTNAGGIRFGGGATTATTQLTGIINLDGGTVSTNKIYMGGAYTGGATYNATVNFNGSILRATQNQTAFLELSTAGGVGTTAKAIVKSGGAIIDSNTFDIKIDQALLHDTALGMTADGGLTKQSTGALTLTNTSTYTGATNVNAGKLVVNGNISTSSLTTVASGATLSGTGTVSALTVNNGGTLAPADTTGVGTLTAAGTLSLNNLSNLAFELNPTNTTVGGGFNDLVTGVTNLTLDGLLNVSASTGSFAGVTSGIWRLFNYSGSLTDNLLSLNTMPALDPGYSWSLDTSTANQINLTIVPEPNVAALLGSIGAFALLRRRRA